MRTLRRFGEIDLLTLGCLVQGRALVEMGRPAEGLPLLDEAMVAVTTEELSPLVAGRAYCAVVLVCQKAFDLRRAHEWTAALSDWCERQPDMVPFRGLVQGRSTRPRLRSGSSRTSTATTSPAPRCSAAV